MRSEVESSMMPSSNELRHKAGRRDASCDARGLPALGGSILNMGKATTAPLAFKRHHNKHPCSSLTRHAIPFS
ncbi:Uncharacterized protein HZ326_6415 [Fusarium oxysporum f. sp. albedinis]|nr:Uncharacterized protein HZ326_6415 [Fusarium oxysporum f. sp. albedinis]